MNKILLILLLHTLTIISEAQVLKTKYLANIYSTPFNSWQNQGLQSPEIISTIDSGVLIKAIGFYLVGNEKDYVGDIKVEFRDKTGWMSSINFNTQEIRKLELLNKSEYIKKSNTKTIQMSKNYGGTFSISCKVNELPLNFIFDTGASDVSISLTEALFMLKNGYLDKSDIIGTEYYAIANGEIKEGTTINIKKLEFGEFKLYNVKASISNELKAPLLLGQSALSKLGKIIIDYKSGTLTVE